MEEILHQLIGSLSHFYRVLYIPGGAGFLPSTVWVRNPLKDAVSKSFRRGFFFPMGFLRIGPGGVVKKTFPTGHNTTPKNHGNP